MSGMLQILVYYIITENLFFFNYLVTYFAKLQRFSEEVWDLKSFSYLPNLFVPLSAEKAVILNNKQVST